MSASPREIQNQIEGLRRNLLDLTLRNCMLSYKPSRRLSVQLEGESSSQIFQLLVIDEKRLSFQGIPDPPSSPAKRESHLALEDPVETARLRKQAEEELDAFLDIAPIPADLTDSKGNVKEPESLLQTKLRSMEREACLANDELGINTLFLSLGVLEWGEPGDPLLRAPLIYVPVRLERLGNGAMRLRHDGTDVGWNLPLRAKLQELNVKLPEFQDEQPVADYFVEVAKAVEGKSDWRVEPNEIYISFFNYEKYAMYIDLGGENWPSGEKPWHNRDLVAILGDGYPDVVNGIDSEMGVDQFRPVQDSREVYDADSSQAVAMTLASRGESMIIEGPPGTGKSQTITNIIAEAVGNGKTVLFVSAKRAALEVVKRNLVRADLGPMCLDLHDKLTNRRAFYEEIKRTVNGGVKVKPEDQKVARLAELTDQLNTLARAVNEPVEGRDTTPFEAMGRLARLPAEQPDDRASRIAFELFSAMTAPEIEQALPTVLALQEKLSTIGVPSQHPFWKCEISYLDPGRRLDLEEELSDASLKLEIAIERIRAAAEALSIPIPATLGQVRVLRACLDQIAAAPEHDDVSFTSPDWMDRRSQILELIHHLKLRTEGRERLSPLVYPNIWETDLVPISDALERHGDQWFRFVFGDFKAAMSRLDSLLLPQAPRDPLRRRDLVGKIKEIQASESKIVADSDFARKLLGVHWKGLGTDTHLFEALQAYIQDLKEKIDSGELPNQLLGFLTGSHNLIELQVLVSEAEIAAIGATAAYTKAAALLEFPASAEAEATLVLVERVKQWHAGLPKLSAYISFLEVKKKLDALNLRAVTTIADHWTLANQRLGNVYLRCFYSGVVREAMDRRPALKRFERSAHEAAIDEFCQLDDFKLVYNRSLVRIAHQQRLPSFGPGTVGNLKTLMLQCQLQRRHRPIRWIMSQAGEAIQQIKPVFMMSPLSVAVHLPPELPKFDLVIFDEASQIKPEDAISAIARAKQTIVVGDPKQMPPTNFFSNLSNQDEDWSEEEVDDLGTGSDAQKLESILSLMGAVTLGSSRRPSLLWHYRSIHSSLIEPSNKMFYDNGLVVFPSPGNQFEGKRIGVVLHYLDDSVYEPGQGGRINRAEADAVAAEVLKHLNDSPEESLLIAAMNKPQADLIYDRLATLERENPAPFVSFRERHPLEPLEVKNLENVQGDERDVVFISITYGKDREGVLRQQFGPLLLDGGERRLNVLITRARRRCEVFTSILADDIRAAAKGNGVDALKSYLQFVQTGELGPQGIVQVNSSDAFDQQLEAFLNKSGYLVKPKLGSSSFQIDLAVAAPEVSNYFVLGVESDGVTYGRARSARDRDKLRSRVLESRGWKLHRVWSHDWWQDQAAEKVRILEAIQSVPSSPDDESPEPDSVETSQLLENGTAPGKPPQTRPYVQAHREELSVLDSDAESYLLEVVKSEGPIVDELLRVRLKAALGLTRENPTMRKKLDEALDLLKNDCVWEDGAYFLNRDQTTLPRNWSSRPAEEKKLDLVPNVEVASALTTVVATSYGVEIEQAIKASFSLMGFKKVSEPAMARGVAIVDQMLANGRLAQNSEKQLIRERV